MMNCPKCGLPLTKEKGSRVHVRFSCLNPNCSVIGVVKDCGSNRGKRKKPIVKILLDSSVRT